MSDKETTRLAAVAQRGENAKVQLRQMESTFEALQKRYYQDVVANTQRIGEVDSSTVYKMIALNDVITDLRAASRRGKAAYAKLEKQRLTKQAGGGDI